MEILEAFDLTESHCTAAELAGCSHHTVARYVAAREAGGLSDRPTAGPQLIDEFRAKLEEWIHRSNGKLRADVAHDKLLTLGFTGSEWTTRGASPQTGSDRSGLCRWAGMELPGHVPDRIHPRVNIASVALLTAGLVMGLAGSAQAATSTVPLGTADSFAVLSGTGVSNVPSSAITGDVGVSPAAGSSITGLTCEEVNGDIYSVDASGPACRKTDPGLLTTARSDQTAAYLDAFGRVPDTTFADGDNQLGDQTLAPGVYRFGSAPSANLIGNLTLDGDADSVWIFQATSDLVTASSSTVTLTGGAQACNIFWQVGSSATLGRSSSFVGTVLAQTSIAVQSQATIEGRVLAGTGAVTLDMNTITRPACGTTPPVVPPVGQPPVDQPPVVAPPVDQPPVDQPPVDQPPVDQPPVDQPPVVAPPVDQPPVVAPPVDQPPVVPLVDQPLVAPPITTPQITTTRQVREVPTGSVGAGDGSMSAATGDAQQLLLAGTLLLAAAGGTALVAARRRRDA